MIYTAEEKSRMDYLFDTFGDYIRGNGHFDIICTEKVGYLMMHVYKGEAQGLRQVVSFDDLLLTLFDQVSGDVRDLKMVGYHDDIDLFPEEIVETRRRLEPILNAMTQDREHCITVLDFYLEHVND